MILQNNSTNGTTVERWTGSDFGPPRPVPADTEISLGTRDRLILGDAVLLRLSGKRYLAEPTTMQHEQPRRATPPGETAVVRRPSLPAT